MNLIGGTQGIGKATAQEFCKRGGSVTIVGRSAERGQQALEELKQKGDNENVSFSSLDVNSISNVKKFCESFRNDQKLKAGLDGLVLCAGGLNYGPRRVTEEGFEVSFVQNYLSRLAIVLELLPLLEKKRGRVMHCLGAGVGGKLEITDLQLENPSWVPFFIRSALNTATLGDIMVRQLGRTSKNVTFFHLAPGLVNTNGLKNQGFPWLVHYPASFVSPLFATDPADVARLIVKLMDQGYKVEQNYNWLGPTGDCIKPAKALLDDDLCAQVWDYSLTLIKKH